MIDKSSGTWCVVSMAAGLALALGSSDAFAQGTLQPAGRGGVQSTLNIVSDVPSSALVPDNQVEEVWEVVADIQVPEPSDLDIFSTLLSDAVRDAYRWPEAVRKAHPQWGDLDASQVVARVAQLPGQGLVVLIDAPPLGESGETPTDGQKTPDADVEQDSWEQTRQRLQGHAPAAAKTQDQQCRACHTLSDSEPAPSIGTRWPTRERLVEAVSRVVAAHGNRVTELAPGERLWVTVNFAQLPAATINLQSTFMGSLQTLTASVASRQPVSIGVSLPKPESQKSNEETAADLHMRQGNYAKAAALYQQAIDAGRNSSSVYANLLKSYVVLGETKQAQEALERWNAARHQDEKPSEPPTKTPEARQLVIEFAQPKIAAVTHGELDLKTFQSDAQSSAKVLRASPPAETPKP